jgi:hypothetical protein
MEGDVMGDFLVGMIFGAFFAAGIAGALHERGLAECEKNLPRTERCEKVWQPVKPSRSEVKQ